MIEELDYSTTQFLRSNYVHDINGKGDTPLHVADVPRTLAGVIFSPLSRLFNASSLSSLAPNANAAAGPFTKVELETGIANLAVSGRSDLDLDGRGCAL